MDTLFLYNTKTLKEKFKTKVFAGDNHITKIAVQIPDNIGGYPKRECEFNLRAIIPEGNMSYIINPNEPYFYITNDITETAQTVKLMMIITHAGNVIGRTNTVDLVVNEPAEAPDPPLTPREEFDEVIAEQRAEIAEQAETISEQATEIEAKDGQISELNDEITEKDGQITELNTENTRLENLTDTQRETIQNMLDNPPQPKLYTPPVVTPSSSVQQINPPTGYDGLNNAVVDRVSAEGVGFNPDYYKEGETCLGKVGTYNPFPERSYGGIYYTELGEGGYPKKILIKNMLRSANTIPQFFNASNDAKRELREVIFENCPGFIVTAANLFQGFNYLTKVQLPDSLTRISDGAFQGCTSLTEINLPDSLTSIGSQAFQSCTSLTELTLPDSLTRISDGAFQSCTSLTELTLPDSLTSISNYAFQNCTSLMELTLPDSLTRISDGAFQNCTSLTELTLPDSLTSISNYAFQNCTSLMELTLPDSLTSIYGGAFRGCASLTELTLPDSLTSIGASAFRSCTSLTELTLPDSLTSIYASAFQDCTSLTELTLPDSLTRISDGAFQNCTSLTELTLPDSLTSIYGNAFQNCTSLTELTLAQGFNCNGLNVSSSTRFTAETIVACLEVLADRTGQTAYTITFGSTNLNKLTAEQKAIATNKNWNLA